MPSVFVHHDISGDKDRWLNSPKRAELLGPLGVSDIRTFVDPNDPTHVGILFTVDDAADLGRLMAATQTEAGREAMAHDGVIPETIVILVEE